MLDKLLEIESALPSLLAMKDVWKSKDIIYHPPRVERLYTRIGDIRIYLHVIHPCKKEDALFHPHPWPSAMRIYDGKYEMGIGHSETMQVPKIDCKLILETGACYEMTDRDGWHYVMPLKKTHTLMITSSRWDPPRDEFKPDGEQPEISSDRISQILGEFKGFHYKLNHPNNDF